MIYLILICLVLAVLAGYFLSALVLFWLAKLFKIANFTYKNSLLVILIINVVGIIIIIISTLLNFGVIFGLIINILLFFIFYWLLKNHQVSWQKALGIFISLLLANIIISLIIIIPVRALIFQPFYVKGATMEPKLSENDYLVVDMMDKNYQKGDIVVFKYPQDRSQNLLKRVVGVPGDKVSISNSKVYINGVLLEENYLTPGTETLLPLRGAYSDVLLKPNEYFLLGDNRNKSLDSRIFGPVNSSLIVGKVKLRLFPNYSQF